MQRHHLLAAVLVLCGVSAGTGCKTCASPFDYCGPVYAGGDCGDCVTFSRAASVLSDPYAYEFGVTSPAPRSRPTPAQAPDEGESFEDMPFDGELPPPDDFEPDEMPDELPGTRPISSGPRPAAYEAQGRRLQLRR